LVSQSVSYQLQDLPPNTAPFRQYLPLVTQEIAVRLSHAFRSPLQHFTVRPSVGTTLFQKCWTVFYYI